MDSNTAIPLAEFHPLASLFPLLDGEEFDALVDDIGRRGLLEPIWLLDGAILDGRNRYAACLAAGVAPAYREYTGDDPVGFVWAMNGVRRHLTASQRAALAVDLKPHFAEQARGRQAHGQTAPGRNAGGTNSTSVTTHTAKARDDAAQLVGVSGRYVDEAERLQREAPDLFDGVREGSMTLTQARREVKERQREERRETNRALVQNTPDVATSGARFATIVMDPPWDWGDEGDVDQMGRARPDYATMSIDDIATLPLPALADDDCHLYMWITNRSLPKGFRLLEGWGFRYVTCLTWVKPSFGLGNYFRGQTEHVLFGVRGSQPLKRRDVGTVFQAPRGKGHSAKPDALRDLVESCSPGPYLEMFARSDREGWQSWGADA